jgi:hypothetical protein
MKSKIDIKVPRGIEKNVKATLEEIIQRDSILSEVGEVARKDIVANIVQAKEPETGKPFANRTITKEWKDRKKELSKTNTPFDAASGGGSSLARLIFTGQFIKSFRSRISKATGRKMITVGPEGTRTPYKNKNGTRMGKTPTNEKLGEYLLDQGRDWLGFPERIRKRIVNTVRAHIRRELTKQNK